MLANDEALSQELTRSTQHPMAPIRMVKAFLSHSLSPRGEEAWDSRAHGLDWAGFLYDPWSWGA